MVEETELARYIGQRVAKMRGTEPPVKLAERLGIKKDRLCSIERGLARATLGELRTISCALGTTVSDLLPQGVREASLE